MSNTEMQEYNAALPGSRDELNIAHMFVNIPESLKAKKQWCVWRLEPSKKRPGKFDKAPYQVRNINKHCANNRPNEWASYEDAVSCCIKFGFNGLMFAITDNDHIVFIDIDHAVGSNDNMSVFAENIIELFNDTYSEYSQSGKGFHILAKGSIPHGFKNDGCGLEMYSGGRFVCLTGNAISKCELSEMQDEIDSLFNQYDTHKEKRKRIERSLPTVRLEYSEQEVIDKAKQNVKYGSKFDDVFNGNWQPYFESQSDADLWMCGILAFWTNCDETAIDRIFRTSGLYRKKWDEVHGKHTYARMTIEKAVDGCSETVSEYAEKQNAEIELLNKDELLPPYRLAGMLKKGKNGVQQSRENIELVLKRDEKLAHKIAHNMLSNSIYARGKLPWDNLPSDRQWTDIHDDLLLSYFEKEYGLASGNKILSELNIIAYEHRYHPVIEVLESLPSWDGADYISQLLPKYLGAEDKRLNAEIMKLFMLGAVNRVFEPGCKFDYVPILVGKQGIGKSYFVSQLAIDPEWHVDNLPSIEGKDAMIMLQGKWIIELGELLAMNKAKEMESIKAFITSQKDTFREAYGHRASDKPRQCVFIGTTNQARFLSDMSGNRRFMPIAVGKNKPLASMWDNADEFHHDIEQAWSQATYIYKSEHPALILPHSLDTEMEVIREAYTDDDYRVGVIQEYLEQHSLKRICAREIWECALHLDNKMGKGDAHQIGEILNRIDGCDFVGKQRTDKYGSQNCWMYVLYENSEVVF